MKKMRVEYWLRLSFYVNFTPEDTEFIHSP